MIGSATVTHVSLWAGTMGPGMLGTVGPETMGSCVSITFWPGVLCAADTGKLRIGYQVLAYPS